MVKFLKIGVDFHGVIDQNPSFFKSFNQKAIDDGHQIYILSGGSEKDVQVYLQENDIPCSHIFSLLDYFKKQNLVTFFEDGRFFVPPELWDEAKAKYCLSNQIDIHIDDSILYGKYFQTPFCLYKAVSNQCHGLKNNITLNFNELPQKVLEDLYQNLI